MKITRWFIGVLVGGSALLLAWSGQSGEDNGHLRATALSGVESIEIIDANQVHIHASRGICKFVLAGRPGDKPIEIHFFYRPGRPFRKIEGIHIFDQRSNRAQSIDDMSALRRLARGRAMLQLDGNTESLDWSVQAIDFYR